MFPRAGTAARAASEQSTAAAVWLFAVAAAVATMVIVGGATRLTGSGLSITQWKPLTGALPPLSAHAWADLFSRYQATPQYELLNRGMTLGGFKSIYWWEWAHRLLARGVGVLFAAPFVILLLTRRLPRRLILSCGFLFALGGLQGLVGWWMVQSGLEERVSVAPERLATHLGLALFLFSALIWTGLEALYGARERAVTRASPWARLTGLFAVLVYLQCLTGALTAGNHAGRINNDWPLMSGRWVPPDYWQGGLWSTLAHGVAAVQFNHRLLAYALVVFALSLAAMSRRMTLPGSFERKLALAVAAVALCQIVLGVATLLSGVALGLALMHQANAALLLALAVILAWRSRRTIVGYFDTAITRT